MITNLVWTINAADRTPPVASYDVRFADGRQLRFAEQELNPWKMT